MQDSQVHHGSYAVERVLVYIHSLRPLELSREMQMAATEELTTKVDLLDSVRNIESEGVPR